MYSRFLSDYAAVDRRQVSSNWLVFLARAVIALTRSAIRSRISSRVSHEWSILAMRFPIPISAKGGTSSWSSSSSPVTLDAHGSAANGVPRQLVVVHRGVTVLTGGHPAPPARPMPNPTTRVKFWPSGWRVLFFNDQRRFGWIRVLDTAGLRADPFLARFGPRPWATNSP